MKKAIERVNRKIEGYFRFCDFHRVVQRSNLKIEQGVSTRADALKKVNHAQKFLERDIQLTDKTSRLYTAEILRLEELGTTYDLIQQNLRQEVKKHFKLTDRRVQKVNMKANMQKA